MNYRKLIEDFTITEVIETDGILQVSGEGDLYCEILLDDVLHHHPSGDVYAYDRHSDRAFHYRIPANEMWNDGTDEGEPINMVTEVFDQVEKVWKDGNDEVIELPVFWEETSTCVFGAYPKTIQKSDNKAIQNLIDADFWIEEYKDGIVRVTAHGPIDLSGEEIKVVWINHTPEQTHVWVKI